MNSFLTMSEAAAACRTFEGTATAFQSPMSDENAVKSGQWCYSSYCHCIEEIVAADDESAAPWLH